MQLSNEWVNQSVSHGTMREEDLIPAFEHVLHHAGEELPERPAAVEKLLAGGELTDKEQETVSYYVNEGLFDALSRIAPDGYYFGAHPGDGCDYGFWAAEEH